MNLSASLRSREKRSARNPELSRSKRQVIIARSFLIPITLLFLTPFYWMIITSLKGNQELVQFPPTLLPQVFQWTNYIDAVNYIPFGRFFLNTVIISVVVIIGAVNGLSSFQKYKKFSSEEALLI